VEFAMTALFLVIAVDQWRSYRSHLPALLGAAATLVCLKVVGADAMLLPALVIIVAVLLLLRRRLEEQTEQPKQEVKKP
jgi:4-azaleucine resistance transporter AzlC